MHDWTDPALAPLAEEWGLEVFAPDSLRTSTDALTRWVRQTGATKVAIHLDVDTVDAAEARLGLGADLGGLRSAEVRHVVEDVSQEFEVVALTIAEFVPRQVLQLQLLVDGFPLLGAHDR